MALCLPRSSCAAWLASRPSTTSVASITCQAWVTSPGLGLYVRTDMPLRSLSGGSSRWSCRGQAPPHVAPGTTWPDTHREPDPTRSNLNCTMRPDADANKPPHAAARHTDFADYRQGIFKVKTAPSHGDAHEQGAVADSQTRGPGGRDPSESEPGEAG